MKAPELYSHTPIVDQPRRFTNYSERELALWHVLQDLYYAYVNGLPRYPSRHFSPDPERFSLWRTRVLQEWFRESRRVQGSTGLPEDIPMNLWLYAYERAIQEWGSHGDERYAFALYRFDPWYPEEYAIVAAGAWI